MIVEIKKADINYENGAPVPAFGSDTGVMRMLNFEGISGFNAKVAYPMLRAIANTPANVYKTYRFKGKFGGEHIQDVTMHTITNNAQTKFIFAFLDSYGINLKELKLAVMHTHPKKFFVHTKIATSLRRSVSSAPGLTEYLYSIFRFCDALDAINEPEIRNIINEDGDSSFHISQKTLNELFLQYLGIEEQVTFDVQIWDDNWEFNRIEYCKTNYSNLESLATFIRTSDAYNYNILHEDGESKMILINKKYTPYGVFVINFKEGIVDTNEELTGTSTMLIGEWISGLACKLQLRDNQSIVIRHFEDMSDMLYSAKPEVVIDNDASEFADFLEDYSAISENLDFKFYSAYFKDSKVVNAVKGATLEEEYEHDEHAQRLFASVEPWYDSFDLKELSPLVKGLIKGEVFSGLFVGESGTGKSSAVKVLAHRAGIPYVSFNCSTNIEESDIIGTMIPNPNKKTAADPDFVWVDGTLTDAVRNGYFCNCEELGFARPGVMGKVNSLLDDAHQLELPNGEVVKAHKNFKFFATTNIGYEGTNRLNKALVNRFQICKVFEDLSKEETFKVIETRTGYTNRAVMETIWGVYTSIKKYDKEQHLGLVVSIRQLLSIFTQGKFFKTAEDAVNNLMLQQAFLEEPEHCEVFKDTVLKVYDLANMKI